MRGITRILRPFVPRRVLLDALKHEPEISGHFLLEARERGKLVQRIEGHNIWTLTGREYMAEFMALQAWSPRTVIRSDRIAYVGLGSGAQSEVAEVSSLVDPVVYRTGQYLAALDAPAAFPSSGTATTNTSVRFTRRFTQGEISLGYNVVLTEAGLFTDGDPDNDWDTTSTPTDFATAAGRAPMAYKTYEPVSKTTSVGLALFWTIRIL